MRRLGLSAVLRCSADQLCRGMVMAVLLIVPLGALAKTPVAYPLSCWYTDRIGELDLRQGCASLRQGKLTISPEHVRRLAYDAHGLATVAVEGTQYYLDRAGRSLAVVAYDNGADAFSEGLVRGQRGGKIGFYNRRFKPVVAPNYDWAWPFDGGKAIACQGCKPIRVDEEHQALSGGRWFYIDRAGREIGPVPGR